MMKKLNILLLILSVMLLSACNLFESLDDKDSSTSTKEFEINEGMNSGDYAAVLVLLNELIQGNADLKAIDDMSDTESYIAANYTNPTVQTYVMYKALEAEARLGRANVGMSDILSELVSSTSSSNMISKNVSSSSDTKIKDLIGGLEGVVESEFLLAVEAYLKALTTDYTAYLTLSNLKGVGDKKLDTDYLSGSVALALKPIHKLLVILDFYEGSVAIENFTAPSWAEFSTNGMMIEWNANVDGLKTQLQASVDILTNYLTKNNSDLDVKDIKDDANAIIVKMTAITNQTQYEDLMRAVGLMN